MDQDMVNIEVPKGSIIVVAKAEAEVIKAADIAAEIKE